LMVVVGVMWTIYRLAYRLDDVRCLGVATSKTVICCVP
jgi:hypothetical protein